MKKNLVLTQETMLNQFLVRFVSQTEYRSCHEEVLGVHI